MHLNQEIDQSNQREFKRVCVRIQRIDAELFNDGVMEIMSRSRDSKRDWLSQIHTARARKRRRTGEITSRQLRDQFNRDQLLIMNWRMWS